MARFRFGRMRFMDEARVSVDDREQHAPDHWTINLGESWEIRFWTRELGCSEEELRRAVAEAGKTAGHVRFHLSNRRRHNQQ